jgi:predicted transcriptional regulator
MPAVAKVLPDGQRCLWTARALARHRGGWGGPGKTCAIGMARRSCERTDCPQCAAIGCRR